MNGQTQCLKIEQNVSFEFQHFFKRFIFLTFFLSWWFVILAPLLLVKILGLVFVPKIRPLKKIIWRTPKFEAFMPVWLYRTAATTTFQVQKSVKMYDKTIHNMWPYLRSSASLFNSEQWVYISFKFQEMQYGFLFSKLVWEMLIYESDASLNKSCFMTCCRNFRSSLQKPQLV